MVGFGGEEPEALGGPPVETSCIGLGGSTCLGKPGTSEGGRDTVGCEKTSSPYLRSKFVIT